MTNDKNNPPGESKKIADLQQHTEDSTGQFLTSNQGLKINDDQNSLKAGARGPSLLEDFLLREKIPISTTNAYRKEWCTQEDQQPTEYLN
jgi:catalase